MIQGIIPNQSFELVRDRIGEILANELLNQYGLTSIDEMNADVWIERFIPFNHTEFPLVNVSFDGGSYDNQTQEQSDGTYKYNIDVFVNSKTEDTDSGDKTAMINLQKLMGICRSILENSIYKKLSFDSPFIMNRHIESIQIADPGKQEATSSVMGRLVMSVRVPETSELVIPRTLNSFQTMVKLEETDLGYLYIADGN